LNICTRSLPGRESSFSPKLTLIKSMYQLFNKLQFEKRVNYFFCFAVITLFFSVLIFSSSILAAKVSLTWEASNSSQVEGYKIHYGQNSSSNDYNNTVIVGNHTSYTVNDLEFNSTYYFVATAYDKGNRESPYSNQVSYTVSKNTTSSSGGGGCKFTINSGFGLVLSILFFLPLIVAIKKALERLRCWMLK